MDTEQILDACLEKALMLHDLNYPTTVVLGKGGNSIERGEPGYFPNVNIQGMSGCGKTCIIKEWAKTMKSILLLFMCRFLRHMSARNRKMQ